MNKKFILLTAGAALSFFLLLTAAGCGKSATEKFDGCISEIRDNVYIGGSDKMSVEVVSGVREQPFAVDGATGEKVEFTVITATPAAFMPGLVYSYDITVGGEQYTGVMTMHPFGESYSAELNVRARDDRLTLTLKQNAYNETLELNSVVAEKDIGPDKALEVALKALAEKLKPWKNSGGYECEIYVRVIKNPINNDGGYFWYVAFMGEETYAALIDMKSAAVIGIKD